MTSYDSFMCPDCERYFRVIWTDPIPSYHDPCSKIKNEASRLRRSHRALRFSIDRIMQAPEPGMPSVEVVSISPRDQNPTR